jgi:hypothetical protein
MRIKFMGNFREGIHKKSIESLEARFAKLKSNLESGSTLEYFSILGIKPTTDMKKIKDAYRSAVKKYHPDIAGKESEMIRKINEAYNMLAKGSFDISEAEIKIYNNLVSSYNSILEEDYKKLRNELSVPVEEWVYEQAISEFRDWRKRLKKAFNKSFDLLVKIRKKSCSMQNKEKNEELKQRLHAICAEAQMLEELANEAYKKIYSELEKGGK